MHLCTTPFGDSVGHDGSTVYIVVGGCHWTGVALRQTGGLMRGAKWLDGEDTEASITGIHCYGHSFVSCLGDAVGI